MVPNLAADNLYKFVAIFGLVMILFAVSYPIQLIQEDKAKMAEVEKESAILKVGMEGKRNAARRLEVETRTKSEQLAAESAALAQKSAQLEEKSKALERQKKLPRSDSPGLVEAIARITDDQSALQADVTARRAKVNQMNAELKPLKEGLDRANDELAVRDIELATQSRLLEGELRHYQMTNLLMYLFGLGGIYMCIKGFALWYYRIQRHHDAILDRHVKEAGIVASKETARKTTPQP